MSSHQHITFIDQQGNIFRAPSNSFSISQVKAPGTAKYPAIQILLSTPTASKHVLWGSSKEVAKIELKNNFNLSGEEKDRAEMIKKTAKLMFDQIVSTTLEGHSKIDVNRIWKETVEVEALKI